MSRVYVTGPPAERFAHRVHVRPTGCWEWRGCTHQGHPMFRVGRRVVRARAFAWMQLRGPLPPGVTPQPTCGDGACINPGHAALVRFARRRPRASTKHAKVVWLRQQPARGCYEPGSALFADLVVRAATARLFEPTTCRRDVELCLLNLLTLIDEGRDVPPSRRRPETHAQETA